MTDAEIRAIAHAILNVLRSPLKEELSKLRVEVSEEIRVELDKRVPPRG